MVTEKRLARFWSYVKVGDGCWPWGGPLDKDGYGIIGSHRGRCKAHRLSWEIANGYTPEGVCVLHHCDNPGCVRPDHLFLGSPADNVRDRTKKGRTARHETHGRAKLTAVNVAEIRRCRGLVTQQALADRFGVAQTIVSRVQLQQLWNG